MAKPTTAKRVTAGTKAKKTPRAIASAQSLSSFYGTSMRRDRVQYLDRRARVAFDAGARVHGLQVERCRVNGIRAGLRLAYRLFGQLDLIAAFSELLVSAVRFSDCGQAFLQGQCLGLEIFDFRQVRGHLLARLCAARDEIHGPGEVAIGLGAAAVTQHAGETGEWLVGIPILLAPIAHQGVGQGGISERFKSRSPAEMREGHRGFLADLHV